MAQSATSNPSAAKFSASVAILRIGAPIVAGIGEGGALAGAIFAQAPAATSPAPSPTIRPSRFTPSRRYARLQGPDDPTGGFAYGPWPSLPGFWVVAFPAGRDTPARRQIAEPKAAGTPVDNVCTARARSGNACRPVAPASSRRQRTPVLRHRQSSADRIARRASRTVAGDYPVGRRRLARCR